MKSYLFIDRNLIFCVAEVRAWPRFRISLCEKIIIMIICHEIYRIDCMLLIWMHVTDVRAYVNCVFEQFCMRQKPHQTSLIIYVPCIRAKCLQFFSSLIRLWLVSFSFCAIWATQTSKQQRRRRKTCAKQNKMKATHFSRARFLYTYCNFARIKNVFLEYDLLDGVVALLPVNEKRMGLGTRCDSNKMKI